MSNPHIPIDLPVHDPIAAAIERENELNDAWDAGYAAAVGDRRWRAAEILLAAIAGAILATALTVAVVHAAPRAAPASEPIPVGGHADQGLLGAPRGWKPVKVLEAEASRVAATPVAEVGVPLVAGIASWCAPTPTRCQAWGGSAHLGAMPGFRFGDEPYRVRVATLDGRRSTIVTVVSYCGCPGARVIDLSPAAFAELAPQSIGLVAVTVEVLVDSVDVPPLATDR